MFSVNHEDKKVLIKGTLIDCKRGQSVQSLDTWARDWGVTKKTVRDFFMLLQKDSMLIYENVQISTRITVCNYDSYQGEVNGEETQSKRKVNAKETVATPKQEYKNDKNDNNKEKPKPSVLVSSKPDYIDSIIGEFSKTYEERYNIPYVVVARGKERDAAGRLAKIYKDKYPESDTDQALDAFRIFFSDAMMINDSFLQNNMTLPMVVSKINDINRILRNGKYREHNEKGGTDSQFRAVIRESLTGR